MDTATPHHIILNNVRNSFSCPDGFCKKYGLTYYDSYDCNERYVRTSTLHKDGDSTNEYHLQGKGGSQSKKANNAFYSYAESLGIAPAWTDVYVNPDTTGHLVALATDGSGNTQYIYHDTWRSQRDILKSYELIEFAPGISRVRKWYHHTLNNDTSTEEDKIIAAMMRLEDKGAVRIGSGNHEPKSSDGLTSLKVQHFWQETKTFGVRYLAKGGKEREIAFRRIKKNSSIERLLASIADHNKNNAYLFSSDPLHTGAVSPQRFTTALQTIAKEPIYPKEFRTWHGSVEAMKAIVENDTPTLKEIASQASERLGNTAAVAKRHYIHPHLLESYRDGSFQTLYQQSSGARCKPYLSRHEMDFYMLLPFLFDHYCVDET